MTDGAFHQRGQLASGQLAAVNRAKSPGEMERNSLAQLARGADAICFFQFRQSVIGAEKYHSAMLPHAGADSRRWREVCRLGELIGRLGEVAGADVGAPAAVLVDWDSAWACQQDAHPSEAVDPFRIAMAAHRAITRHGVGCDVIGADADPSGYAVIVVPALVLLSAAQADHLATAAAGGAHVLVTYFSGVADRTDRIVTGGYPGVFRHLPGVRTEEFHPLGPDQRVRWDDGTTSSIWAEDTAAGSGTQVVATYADGPTAGAAWYLSTQPDARGLVRVLARILAQAGAAPTLALPADHPAGIAGEVDVVRRGTADRSWLFALNHSATEITLPVSGHDLVSQAAVDGELRLAAGGYAVVRED